MENVKTIQLICQDCGGTMNINEGREVLMCPYCGSKSIIVESDAVKIQRIRSEAEIEKQRVEHEYRREDEKSNFKEAMLLLGVLIIIMIILW